MSQSETETTVDDQTEEPTGTPVGGTEETAGSQDDQREVDETVPPAGQSAGEGGGNEEAKRYRLRLRETEGERDQLRTRLEGAQRREVERLAGERLVDPSDVWRDGLTLEDVTDDEGNIDASRVRGSVHTLLEQHPHWAPAGPSRRSKPKGRDGGAGNGTPPSMGSAFGDALRRAAR